jgi:hypothetical protein
MRMNRTWIRNRLIALGLIVLAVPVALHIIASEGKRAEYQFLATNARRASNSRTFRMPDGRVLRDPWEHVAEKYERAARYPWLPLAPDPPKPKGGGYPKWTLDKR